MLLESNEHDTTYSFFISHPVQDILTFIFQHSFIHTGHVSMDHSPIRQTFELGKFISTAGKSIINLVKL